MEIRKGPELLRALIIGIILIVSTILQSSVFGMIRIRGISPNFNMMIIISFALLRGSKEGALIGFFSGFLMDICFSMTKGYLGIIGACIGYVSGKFNKDFYRENLILPFVLTFASTMIHGLAMGIPFLLRGKTNYAYFITSIIIPETIYTIILSIIVYQLIYMINNKIEEHEKTNRKIF